MWPWQKRREERLSESLGEAISLGRFECHFIKQFEADFLALRLCLWASLNLSPQWKPIPSPSIASSQGSGQTRVKALRETLVSPLGSLFASDLLLLKQKELSVFGRIVLAYDFREPWTLLPILIFPLVATRESHWLSHMNVPPSSLTDKRELFSVRRKTLLKWGAETPVCGHLPKSQCLRQS